MDNGAGELVAILGESMAELPADQVAALLAEAGIPDQAIRDNAEQIVRQAISHAILTRQRLADVGVSLDELAELAHEVPAAGGRRRRRRR